MKKVWNITWRVLLAIFAVLYVTVALLTYSITQSYLGSAASSYFSRQWGATVRIGSLHATPWDHLIAHDILLVAPDGDTIFDGEALRLKFRHFPYKGGNIKEGGKNVGTLELERLYIGNAYYHFASIIDSTHAKPYTNLQFIIDAYATDKPKGAHQGETFTVDVGTVVLNHVHYRMDLPDHRKVKNEVGVEIPHMEFYDIRARIKDVHVVNDDVTARIVKLATEERGGFVVEKISAKVHVSPQEIRARDLVVETPRSHIVLDALLEYDGWEVMNDYLNTVQHTVDIKDGTTVAMADVAHWAPVLWGIEAQIVPCGKAHGTVNDLHTEGLSLRFGHASWLAVEGTVRMVEKVDSLNVDLQRLDVRFEQSDLASLRTMLPQYITPQVAQKLDELGYLDLTATATGGLHRQSAANINLVCALGNLRADATASPEGMVTLEASSDGLGLQAVGSDWLTHTGFDLSAWAKVEEGRWNVEKGEAELQLLNSVVRGRHIAPATLHAELAADTIGLQAQCDDSLAAFTLAATATLDSSRNTKGLTLEADLHRLVPQAFGLMPKGPTEISTRVTAKATGTVAAPDSLSGNVVATGTHIGLAKGDIELKHMRLDVESKGDRKRMRFDSEPLEMTLGGRFRYADLPMMMQHFAAQVLPADLVTTEPLDSLELETIAEDRITFTANWNDNGTLLRRAGSQVAVSQGTRISGSYNQRELLKLALRSDSIRIGSVLLDNLGLSSRNAGANYIVDLESQEVDVGTTQLLSRLNLTLGSNAEHSIVEMLWGDTLATTHGDIMLRYADGGITVQRPHFYIGDTRWTLAIDTLQIAKETNAGKQAVAISGSGLSLSSGQQSIVASLALRSKQTTANATGSTLILDFDRFNLGGLCSVVLQGTPLHVDGRVGGHFEMYDLEKTPYFNAALEIDSCIVNRQPLGLVKAHSTWNAELGTVNLDLNSEHLEAKGYLGLAEKDPTLAFAARFNSFQLALAAPFVASFSSRFEGLLHGNFDISGTMSHPVILGDAMVQGGALKVDLTGVTYFFDDSISFTNNAVALRNFVLRDQRNNLATLNGKIHYGNLDLINLNLDLATDNILLLDQKRGDDFYGTLLASANATLKGRIPTGTDKQLEKQANIDIDVAARTNPGCNLTVPLSNLKHVKTQNYITFVSDEPSTLSNSRTAKQTSSQALPVNITVDLNITPDLKLNLPMDFSELQAAVGASGSGDLHIVLDQTMNPFVTGSYEIIDGDLKLTMLSLLEKNFTIENGSNISFNGTLPEARFDLRAVYSQRANLSTLTGSLSSVDNTQKYIQVDDIIAIAGTLQEPTINFDLRLPNADQSVQEEVFSYIDRNSERDMINQTISLLLLGQFYNVSGTDQNGATAASGGIGTIASTMGSFMADMVQIVDINVDYKAATDLTNQQLDVNISKDWGRWYLESTLGYGGDSREIETTTANGTVIDALVGYRISPLVHLFAYNRTNTNDYTRTDLPYKQGVGLKLTKDFDSWAHLFGHSSKPKKKNKK